MSLKGRGVGGCGGVLKVPGPLPSMKEALCMGALLCLPIWCADFHHSPGINSNLFSFISGLPAVPHVNHWCCLLSLSLYLAISLSPCPSVVSVFSHLNLLACYLWFSSWRFCTKALSVLLPVPAVLVLACNNYPVSSTINDYSLLLGWGWY